jgi:hypothetical protein
VSDLLTDVTQKVSVAEGDVLIACGRLDHRTITAFAADADSVALALVECDAFSVGSINLLDQRLSYRLNLWLKMRPRCGQKTVFA